jgi:hypothetical protein
VGLCTIGALPGQTWTWPSAMLKHTIPDPKDGPPMLLTECRDCSSKLLQLEQMWLLPDGRHVARRRCPECQRVDTVSAHPLALWAWRRRIERQREDLERRLLEVVEDAGELRLSDVGLR